MNIARQIPRFGFCLLAGVVISYGVAWWFAYRLSEHWWLDDVQIVTGGVDRGVPWPVEVPKWPDWMSPDHIPAIADTATTSRHSAGAHTRTFSSYSKHMITSVDETSFGWPAATAVRYSFSQLASWTSPSRFSEDWPPWYGGWHACDVPSTLNPLATVPLRVPLKPLWGGLAVNAVIYGAMVYACGAAIAWARRANRRRRKLCDACKYPWGASAVCTECGKPRGPS